MRMKTGGARLGGRHRAEGLRYSGGGRGTLGIKVVSASIDS